MRRHLTFANVMVVLLAFVVLGGGAYAATQLPKNSVGTKQLKKGAVTKAKIKKSALQELRGAQGPTGPQGPAGAAAPAGGLLGAGVTVRGVAATGVNGGNAEFRASRSPVGFGGFQLQTRPMANVVPVGGPATAACPGSAAQPEAAPGNLCVYLTVAAPTKSGTLRLLDPSTPTETGLQYDLAALSGKPLGDGRVSKFGFSIVLAIEATLNSQVEGTWAVTG